MDVGGALLLGPAEEGQVSSPAWIVQERKLLGGLGDGSLVGEGVVEGRGGVEGPLPCVWERLGGQQEQEAAGAGEGPPPLYDQCFQGF